MVKEEDLVLDRLYLLRATVPGNASDPYKLDRGTVLKCIVPPHGSSYIALERVEQYTQAYRRRSRRLPHYYHWASHSFHTTEWKYWSELLRYIVPYTE